LLHIIMLTNISSVAYFIEYFVFNTSSSLSAEHVVSSVCYKYCSRFCFWIWLFL